ncbi:MAG: PelD GGDEF domain-containing protein [Burkholderiales bacterium]
MSVKTRRRRLWVRTLMRSFVDPAVDGPWVWLETWVLTLLALGIGVFASPDDPFFVDREFPWLWFMPVLVALRYSVLPGVLSAGILLGGWLLLQPDAAEFPKQYFLGGLLLVMICGEYSSIWRTRLRRMRELNLYLDDRMSRITKRLYLLRVSHDRLEQDLISKPATLRDLLVALRRQLKGTDPLAPETAQRFLSFLAQYSQLEVAAIYARTDRPGEAPGYELRAQLGNPRPLAMNDPLLRFARERGTLAHVQTEELVDGVPSEHLLVAPLAPNSGREIGVLVVDRMPFFALNQDALKVLGVLLGLYADSVASAELAQRLFKRHPELPFAFAEELVKLQRIGREHAIVSHLVVFDFAPQAEREDIYLQLGRQSRAPDIRWDYRHGERCVMVTLMPLATSVAVEGYLIRIDNWLQQNFGGDLTSLGVSSHVLSLADHNAVDQLMRFVRGTR